MTKICKECKQEKDESEFYKNLKSKDGLHSQCKECLRIYRENRKKYTKEYMKQYNKNKTQEEKEKKKQYSKNYYETHKEQYKLYREQNAEQRKLNKRHWDETHKEEIKKYNELNKEHKLETNRFLREKKRKYYDKNKDKIEKEYPNKICSRCKQTLTRDNFYIDTASTDGLSYWCKDCQRKYDKERKEKVRQRNKQNYNSEKAMEYYYENKRNVIMNNNAKQRRKIDKNFAINCRMQNLLNSILKAKRLNSPILLERCGYTAKQLLEHLEQQFTSEMNWDNYGNYWELDHIIPKYKFYYENYSDEQFKQCWSLNNLRPLTVKENQSRNKS